MSLLPAVTQSDSVGAPIYIPENEEISQIRFIYMNARKIMYQEAKENQDKQAILVARKTPDGFVEVAMFDIHARTIGGTAVFDTATGQKLSDDEIISDIRRMVSHIPMIAFAEKTTRFLFENEY